MKLANAFSILLLLVTIPGCSLWPKQVEYWQDKVHKVPEANEDHLEVRKEAAAFIAKKTEQTVKAAIQENASTNVTIPAVESALVAYSLSGSLGKPEDPWKWTGATLAHKLDRMDAKLDSRLAEFKEDNDKNNGKKIEGTGFIQMGYFTHLILVAVIIGIIWFAVKMVGTIYGGPVAGVGMKVIEGGASSVAKLVSKGFSEVIAGGEHFKDQVKNKIDDPALQKQVIDMFVESQQMKQSPDVQKVIKDLTTK